MTWFYNGKPFTAEQADGYVGYVYLITNKINGRKYIGKKLFTRAKAKKIKNSVRKRRLRVTSDWEVYYGSNKELCEDVKKHGPENFERSILRLCTSKSETSYHEAKWQFDTDAILRDDFYNQWIMVKIHRNSTLDKGS